MAGFQLLGNVVRFWTLQTDTYQIGGLLKPELTGIN
jgi:hypothetical protein